MVKERGRKLITQNRRARHDWSVIDTYETGIVLTGTEVKSLRQGKASRRTRKLLLHRREIDRLTGKLKETGLSLVPLSMYFSDGKAKVELALARGKKSYDKRQDIARRDAQRQMQRAIARARKGRR